MGRQAFVTHMVHRETFLQIQLRPLQHLIRRNLIHGVPDQKSRFTHPQWKRVRNKHKFKIRDASLDSQPKILSSSVEETLQRIMEQTNNDSKSSVILTSKEESVWRKSKLKKKTASSEEDRSLTWSTSSSGSLVPTILSRLMPTYLLLLFEMMIFRNSIRMGRNFIINDENPIWWYLGRTVQTKNTRV